MVLVVFFYVEVHAAVAHVGISVVQYLAYKLFLLNDMSCGMRFYAWRQHVESLHGLMISVGVVLCNFHRLELFQPCLLGYLVIALVGIMLQMAYIGDVPHIAHLVTQMLEIAEKNIERDCRTGMSQMRVAIYGRSTHVHTHVGCMQRLKTFLASGKGIVYNKCLFHDLSL